VGILLLLKPGRDWKTILGIDRRHPNVLAGYRIFYNSISALRRERDFGGLAICVAVIAALCVGEYWLRPKRCSSCCLARGLEAYAAGRTRPHSRFVEQLPRTARPTARWRRGGRGCSHAPADDQIVVRAGERFRGRVIEQGFRP